VGAGSYSQSRRSASVGCRRAAWDSPLRIGTDPFQGSVPSRACRCASICGRQTGAQQVKIIIGVAGQRSVGRKARCPKCRCPSSSCSSRISAAFRVFRRLDLPPGNSQRPSMDLRGALCQKAPRPSTFDQGQPPRPIQSSPNESAIDFDDSVGQVAGPNRCLASRQVPDRHQ